MVRVRGLSQVAAEATHVDTFEEALAQVQPGQVIEWPGEMDSIACLDVDYHDRTPPAPARLRGLAAQMTPRPGRWWLSKSGGLHAIFKNTDHYTASELASAAAVWMLQQGTGAEVEVLGRTAAPATPPTTQTPSVDRMLALWSARGAAAERAGAVDDFLAGLGWRRGGRYPNTQCPGDPYPNSKGGTPVVVYENHVHCFCCAAKGKKATWDLVGLACGFTASRIREAAHAFVYWAQAKFLLLDLYPDCPVPILRRAWRAYLKAQNGGDDPRVRSAFAPFACLRNTSHQWIDSSTFTTIEPKLGLGVIKTMPSTKYVDDDGEVRTSPLLRDLHETNQPIPGFPLIAPVRGLKLWGQHNDYPDDGAVRVVRPTNCAYPPRYLHMDERLTRAKVHAAFCGWFPGIEMNFLKLCLVLRAFGESERGPIPIVLVVGPTGAAKTTIPLLAGSISGDTVSICRATTPKELDQHVGDRAEKCGFILLDEFGKDDVRGGRLLFNSLLALGRQYTYKRMYKGNVSVPLNSVFLITGNSFPDYVLNNQQLGRRMIYCQLHRRAPARWEETCGVGDVALVRTDAEMAHAADSLLSYVIDDYVGPGQTDLGFKEAAKMLGWPTLEAFRASEEGGGVVEADVRRLFAVIGTAPGCDPDRWPGTGWKSFTRGGNTTHEKLWQVLCDDPYTSDGWAASVAVAELDLTRVLGAEEVVVLDFVRRGDTLGLRFRALDSGAINGDIPTEIKTDEAPGALPGLDASLWEDVR